MAVKKTSATIANNQVVYKPQRNPTRAELRDKENIRRQLLALKPQTEFGRRMIEASLKVLDSETPLLQGAEEINQYLERTYQDE